MRPVFEFAHLAIEMDQAEGGYFSMGHLRILASWTEGWDHLSVCCADRCPTWEEMELVKRTFMRPDEIMMQLHVPVKEHVNVHPFVLHMWRPHNMPIPRPPERMV